MSTTNVSYLDYNGLSLVANKVRERLQKVSSMPTSPSTGDVVLYIGTTSSSYTKGHIYQYNNNTWTDISPAGGSGSGDMLESDYDPDGNVKTAGGIEDYTSQTSLSRLENAVLGARNLLEIDRTTQTIDGIRFQISSSGIITANGTATNDIYFILADNLNLPSSDLIVSKGYDSDTSHNCRLIIDAYTSNDIYVKTLANSNLTDEQNFLPDYEDYEIIKAALVISQNDTVNNLKIKPMIRFAIDPNNSFSAYCKTNRQLTDTTRNLTTTVNNLTTTMLNKADKVSSATSGNFAGLDSNGNLTDSGSKASDFLTSHQDISGKADKVTSATNGNFAGLDSNGNLTDSGSKASDFLTSHQDISGKADKVTGATNGNFAGLDANGNLTDSGHKHSDYLTSHQDISGKADKVTSATSGNIAALDANGNLTDSGKTLGVSVPSNAVFTDTKNTAGSSDSSSKLYLIGATSQTTNPQTYSHDTAYVGTDGCLYSNSLKVSTDSWLATTATVSNGAFSFNVTNYSLAYEPWFNVTASSTNKNPSANISSIVTSSSTTKISYTTDADEGSTVKLRIIR